MGSEISELFTRARMLSPDGRCKFGDASANGFVRSEGAGIVVLKRPSRARADGDRIYAVIRGGATNNDGRSSGRLVTPSRPGLAADAAECLEGCGDRSDQAALYRSPQHRYRRGRSSRDRSDCRCFDRRRRQKPLPARLHQEQFRPYGIGVRSGGPDQDGPSPSTSHHSAQPTLQGPQSKN
jgi:hypothetical protein